MLTIMRPQNPALVRPDMSSELIRRVTTEYGEPFASAQFVAHASSGFSGARLWRCDIGDGRYVLRRWPDGQMNYKRLSWIHRMLRDARQSELAFVPDLVSSKRGGTCVEDDGTFWQLETWLPGEADLSDPPSITKVAAAVESLARFHAAVAGDYLADPWKCGSSPALGDRAELLDEMLNGGVAQIRNSSAFSAPRHPWAGIAVAAWPWLNAIRDRAERMQNELAPYRKVVRPLQPVIRDVTRDHVLFTGNTVTGLVDYGAMSLDHVTVDLARLAGSYGLAWFSADYRAVVDCVCETYRASKHARRLTDEEREEIVLLDRSGVLVAAYRWLRWIFVEERSFSDPQAVSDRIRKLIARDSAL
jgi:homoserine kinase type II